MTAICGEYQFIWQSSVFFICFSYLDLTYQLVRASLVAQLIRNLPEMQETWVQSLGWEDPPEKGKDTPPQYSVLENSMDCIVHRVAKSWTQLSLTHYQLVKWLRKYQRPWFLKINHLYHEINIITFILTFSIKASIRTTFTLEFYLAISWNVHWVSDAIQPSHPLSSLSLLAFSLSQHQGLYRWVSSSHQVVK